MKGIIEKTNVISDEIGGLEALSFDDKGVTVQVKNQLDNQYYDQIKNEDSLSRSSERLPPCNCLIESIANSPASCINLRRILIRSTLGENEVFDDIIHSDLNFVETNVSYFITLISSPSNTMQHSSLVRTAASFTSVIILNNIFVSNNNLNDLTWFEKEIATTGTTKWDGVAFSLKDKRVASFLFEFSGGIKFNSTMKKEQRDEKKMVEKIISILKFNEALNITGYPVIQHYVRFVNGVLFLEAICLLENGVYIKRRYFTVKCPSTAEELISFVKKIPLLLDWKQTTINWTKVMTADLEKDY